MSPLDLTNLLKDYGPWGIVALLLLALRTVTGWWRECMMARIDERGASATALERQAASNTAVAATLDDVREGQIEIAKLAAEALKGAEGSAEFMKSQLGDIKARLDRGGV